MPPNYDLQDFTSNNTRFRHLCESLGLLNLESKARMVNHEFAAKNIAPYFQATFSTHATATAPETDKTSGLITRRARPELSKPIVWCVANHDAKINLSDLLYTYGRLAEMDTIFLIRVESLGGSACKILVDGAEQDMSIEMTAHNHLVKTGIDEPGELEQEVRQRSAWFNALAIAMYLDIDYRLVLSEMVMASEKDEGTAIILRMLAESIGGILTDYKSMVAYATEHGHLRDAQEYWPQNLYHINAMGQWLASQVRMRELD